MEKEIGMSIRKFLYKFPPAVQWAIALIIILVTWAIAFLFWWPLFVYSFNYWF